MLAMVHTKKHEPVMEGMYADVPCSANPMQPLSLDILAAVLIWCLFSRSYAQC